MNIEALLEAYRKALHCEKMLHHLFQPGVLSAGAYAEMHRALQPFKEGIAITREGNHES